MKIIDQFPFVIPLFVMFCSEITKHLLHRLVAGKWFEHGGMPSSHSAFVTSLLIVVWMIDGMQSTAFTISVVFAGIVWYDALFVRRAVGNQAKMLNSLQQIEKFPERIGHSFLEVVGGIVFGTIMTLLVL